MQRETGLMNPQAVDATAMHWVAGLVDLSSRTEAAVQPRILLVDDEPRLLGSLAALLQEFDFDISTATCGAEALAQLTASAFDLVLLDLRMPDMSGHDVMDFIIAQGLDCNVIVLSGDTGIDAAIDALKRGAVGYLRKPYRQEELLNTVVNTLQKRKLQAENRRIAWQLECSERLYRYLVDSSPDIIYTLNAEGEFTFINDRVGQLLGFHNGDLVGQHYSQLIHPEDLERAHYVFNERRVGVRATRDVELRLKDVDPDHGGRSFDHSLMTISFNSMGVYSSEETQQPKEYFGTYGVARDVTERKRNEEMISHQAYHDVLTDLPNRVLYRDRLELALSQAKRNQTELAVMFVDLDRFKRVNDSLGHQIGDKLLQQVALRLKKNLRSGDTLARLGGDEFILLLPELRERQHAAIAAEKLRDCLSQPFQIGVNELYVSASIGISIYPSDGETMDALIQHADIAMYHVKSLGKNDHCFFQDSMHTPANQHIGMDNSLRKALAQDEFEMYYQPQVDVATGRITGAEALMRWNHPQRGMLSAGEFLPYAEDNGLMLPISDWMIRTVCADLAGWDAAGGALERVSLNISPAYLDRGDVLTKLRDAMLQHAIRPSQIEIEITENVCIRNPLYAIDQLNKLSQLGVKVAIDDFGTGYSSLAYLHRFPVDTIKIDQSFVREILQEDGHYPVVLAVISIARGLGLHLVAEGVETACQARYLEQAGCTVMQGYLYYRAMPKDEFVARLHDHTASID